MSRPVTSFQLHGTFEDGRKAFQHFRNLEMALDNVRRRDPEGWSTFDLETGAPIAPRYFNLKKITTEQLHLGELLGSEMDPDA